MTVEMRTEIDKDLLGRYIKNVGATIAAGFNCAISAAGERLNLYSALAEIGPATSVQLAERTGLHERWVREWLRHQACVGHIDYDAADDAFYMTPEAVAVLADEDSPAFLVGGFDSVLAAVPATGKLSEAFRTGLGMTYDDHGAECACGIERLSAYTQKRQLVPELLPLMDDVVDKLRAGAQVADVGCGGAQSTIAMARAFPSSSFTAFDISQHALDRASANLSEAGVDNVRLVDPREAPMPSEPTYDLVTTFDVVHDTPYPAQLIADIRASLKPDGSWLCEDIKSFPTFEQNLNEHPLAGMLYGFSVLVCMSSGLSTPDGAGLGTLGFNEEVAREMTSEAGFTRFRTLEFENPFNNYYEVRP